MIDHLLDHLVAGYAFSPAIQADLNALTDAPGRPWRAYRGRGGVCPDAGASVQLHPPKVVILLAVVLLEKCPFLLFDTRRP